MKKKKLPIKLFATVLLVLVFFALWGVDTARATKYDIDVVAISNTSLIADGEDQSVITIRVSRGGKPCANHEIMFEPSDGTLDAYLVLTDENGLVDVVYTAYEETRFKPAGEVTIEISDLSNSLLIEVNAKASLTLNLRSPEVA